MLHQTVYQVYVFAETSIITSQFGIAMAGKGEDVAQVQRDDTPVRDYMDDDSITWKKVKPVYTVVDKKYLATILKCSKRLAPDCVIGLELRVMFASVPVTSMVKSPRSLISPGTV